MAIFQRSQDQTFELHGNHMTGLATASRGAEQVEVWRFTMDEGAATPVHCHDCEEIVHVIKGGGVARLGGQELTFGEGDTLILPEDVEHQIVCTVGPLEGVAALSIGSLIRSPDGELLDLPWRH